MFVDSINLTLCSGKGGKGCVSFRREKHVPLGGPDGGDGGCGGDVFITCDNNTHTLIHFKGKKILSAQNGQNGKKRNQNGKKGENLELYVPLGTQILDANTKEILLDFTKEGERKLFLKGGKGGLGNTHFKHSRNQSPHYAQNGLEGITLSVILELKLIADVALVGFPNVGKSTLISKISNAKPEIADYEFTTLNPKLGLVRLGYDSFVIADIPGIIKNASLGKGLGLKFLKHIERSSFLLFVLDCTKDSIKEQFLMLKAELKAFSQKLYERKFGVIISKIDLRQNDFTEKLNEAEEYLKTTNCCFVKQISSIKNIALNELCFELLKNIRQEQ